MFMEYKNNLLIYFDNLSVYYVTCVLVSIAAIIASWVLHFNNVIMREPEVIDTCTDTMENTNTTDSINEDVEGIISKIKLVKKHTIEKMSATLTDEQLEAEKKAESEQLAAILELLKKEEEKFQVGSMEELEGQLRLYR